MNVTKIRDEVYIIMDKGQCCTNLIVGRDRALVFDTCAGVENLLGEIRRITDLPLLVINSHGHFDHIGGNSQFETAYLRAEDLHLRQFYPQETMEEWFSGLAGESGPLPTRAGDFGNTVPLDFDYFDLGDMECHIIPMPGHTAGSVGVYIPKLRLLLSGDALTPVLMLMVPGHTSREDAMDTIRRAKELDIDGYLTGHYDKVFTKEILDRLLHCLESVPESDGYKYQYPKPPFSKGRLYMENGPGDHIAVVV